MLMVHLSRHSISLLVASSQGTLEPLRCPIGRLALAGAWSMGVTLLGAPGGSEGGSSSEPSCMAEKGAMTRAGSELKVLGVAI